MALEAENKRLRSEVARAFAKRDDALAENERLRVAKPGCLYHCECDRLTTENERLQASNLASEIARANQRNDELWAGIEAVTTERDELRAERDELRAEIAADDAIDTKLMLAEQEIERLRAVVDAARQIALRQSKTHDALRKALAALDNAKK